VYIVDGDTRKSEYQSKNYKGDMLMNISKTQKGLLALPLLVGGIIGIAALASNHISAAPTQQASQSQTAPSNKPEASDPADTNEPAKNSRSLMIGPDR